MSSADKAKIFVAVLTFFGILIETIGGGLIANWNGLFAPPSAALEITAPADVQVVATAQRTTIDLGLPSYGGGIGKLTIKNDAPPRSVFAPGQYTVIWTVTDGTLSSATDTQQVVITKPSELTCKADRFNVPNQSIRTSGNDAKPVNGDSEIDSNDWTRVSIDYDVAVLQKNSCHDSCVGGTRT